MKLVIFEPAKRMCVALESALASLANKYDWKVFQHEHEVIEASKTKSALCLSLNALKVPHRNLVKKLTSLKISKIFVYTYGYQSVPQLAERTLKKYFFVSNLELLPLQRLLEKLERDSVELKLVC